MRDYKQNIEKGLDTIIKFEIPARASYLTLNLSPVENLQNMSVEPSGEFTQGEDALYCGDAEYHRATVDATSLLIRTIAFPNSYLAFVNRIKEYSIPKSVECQPIWQIESLPCFKTANKNEAIQNHKNLIELIKTKYFNNKPIIIYDGPRLSHPSSK